MIKPIDLVVGELYSFSEYRGSIAIGRFKELDHDADYICAEVFRPKDNDFNEHWCLYSTRKARGINKRELEMYETAKIVNKLKV